MANTRPLILAAIALGILSFIPLAPAQDSCFEFVNTAFDTSGNGAATPSNPRAYDAGRLYWRGEPYLWANTGNGLTFWDLDDPSNPRIYTGGGTSWLNIIPDEETDRDHFIFNFSMCDDCRYGIAGLEEFGMILFDLGVAGEPHPISGATNDRSIRGRGGFTFFHSGSQYVVLSDFEPACNQGFRDGSAVSLFTSIDSSNLSAIDCVANSNGPAKIEGGFKIQAGGQTYLYLFDDSSSRFGNIYRVTGSGSSLRLLYLGSPFSGSAMRRVQGLAIDEANSLLAQISGGNAKIWDITDPSQPVMMASWVVPDTPNSVAIGYPYLWFARPGSDDAHFYDITVPTNPKLVSEDMWLDTEEYNQVPFAGHTNAEFNPANTHFYLARYSVLQVFESNGVCGSGPPTANLNQSPSEIFPGDTVTISNASSGTVDRFAIWVEDGAGSLVAGSAALSASTSTSLQFQVPDTKLKSPYTAYVAVENDDNPYFPGSPGSQEDSEVLVIDLTPTVAISISPSAVITGDTATLSFDAQGNPIARTWELTPPAGAQCPTTAPWNGTCTNSGATPNVFFADSGQWTVDLAVNYALPSQATDSIVLDLTSVAASMVLPSDPSVDDPITVTSDSRFSTGATINYTWLIKTLGGSTAWSSCPSAQSCTIPAGVLSPDTYVVELTIRNPANGDSDTTSGQMTVRNRFNLDFSFSPTSPDIGDSVIFSLSGIAAQDVASVDWTWGGNGCDASDPASTTCTPNFVDCLQAAHKYNSQGSKSVRVVVHTVGSDTLNAGPKTVTVNNAGSCGGGGGGGGGGCTYSFSPPSASVSSAGGTGSFNVTASQSSCSTSASDNASWLTVTNPGGTGNRTVNYSATANSTSNNRSGRITIDGTNFTVSQAAGQIEGDFSWNGTPEAGTLVIFTISGVPTTSIQSVDWDFGSPGCGPDYPAQATCTPNFESCTSKAHSFESPGQYPVKATVNLTSGGTEVIGPKTVTIEGGFCALSCELNSAPTANFTVTPSDPVIGDSVTFTNTSSANTEIFEWTIRRGLSLIETSSSQSFSYIFEEEGTYQIRLTASNCKGEDIKVTDIEVIEFVPPSDLVVPATVAASGINDTQWKSDLRIFNPNEDPINVTVEFLAQATDNSNPLRPFLKMQIGAKGTVVLDDIVHAFTSLAGQDAQGALRVTTEDNVRGTVTPLVTSRIYNDTPAGTYGQLVTAVGIDTEIVESITLSGLASNGSYRTNIGLANLAETPAGGIVVKILDPDGSVIGTHPLGIPALSSVQVVNIAEVAGVVGDLDLFSIEVETNGKSITAYASVVDNFTGDPVLLTPQYAVESTKMIIPGMAHLPGLNNSQWRSYMSMHNPTNSAMTLEVTYVPEVSSPLIHGFNQDLSPKATAAEDDVVASVVSDDNTKGYFVIESTTGIFPAITARTYNQAVLGTFGQNILAFADSEMLNAGDIGFIPGVSNSASTESGFRTNIGFVNASNGQTVLDITLYDEFGQQLSKIPGYTLSRDQSAQFNVFQAVGLGSAEAVASIELEITSGGPLAAYASVVENLSQDPILVPATKMGR